MTSTFFPKVNKTQASCDNYKDEKYTSTNYFHKIRKSFNELSEKLTGSKTRKNTNSSIKEDYKNSTIHPRKSRTSNRFFAIIAPRNTNDYKNEIIIKKSQEISAAIPTPLASSYSYELESRKEKLIQIVNQINDLKGRYNSMTSLQNLNLLDSRIGKLEYYKEQVMQEIKFYATQMPEYNPHYRKVEYIDAIDFIAYSKLAPLEKELETIRNTLIGRGENTEHIKEKLNRINNINTMNEFESEISLFIKSYLSDKNDGSEKASDDAKLETINSIKFAHHYKTSELSLSDKGLSAFPKVLLKLKNLEHLDLSNNPIQSIPAQLLQMDRLRSINLTRTHLISQNSRISPNQETLNLISQLRAKGIQIIVDPEMEVRIQNSQKQTQTHLL
ncbi:leucine-rich repeat domain-containing protein [Mycoavidus sp. B2-EB]|uniref:leucine-rich repeat domain-containing protein n=1 Tax=Mycoavidus sp. B2-EB TaxID=2651972 RepID=UPI001628A04B|nr:leucine-rich repeat domain-containing protein [Mycoavidus sp. B2-EB]BBO59506.1 hypothetical protein MPB2EB_0625 [Mycoavidus sp. B2-EB]